MIDNLKDAIKEYKDFAECETETARVLRNIGNEKDAKYYEETAENDKKIVAWLTELQERRQADEWILVGKRLPDFDEEVLVCYRTQGGMSQMVSYRMDNGHWWGLSVMCYKPVAWKPLGKPYKRPYTRKKKNNG